LPEIGRKASRGYRRRLNIQSLPCQLAPRFGNVCLCDSHNRSLRLSNGSQNLSATRRSGNRDSLSNRSLICQWLRYFALPSLPAM
jgi:hypothetical protein